MPTSKQTPTDKTSSQGKQDMVARNGLHILVDGIKSMGIHNGIVRINFMRLDTDGKDEVVLQLGLPQSQAQSVAKALNGIAR